MTLKVKRGRATLLAQRIRALEQALPRLATRAAKIAELQAKRGLMLNVYGTAPGTYQRTEQLLLKVYAAGQAGAGRINVVVGDQAAYASLVEYGTGPSEFTEPQLLGYLEAMPEPRLLRFGRSGQKYLLPGPYVLPAVFIARHQTRQAVQGLIRTLWE
ncbi:hypothetical protein [Deinococcus sp.]|uniref:hypothetical protein n=1 Tax=Deinococcus sp. TaxID=47478 RepID=UPI002869E664|nr:hypothetical protein [Deinococcus sp.]